MTILTPELASAMLDVASRRRACPHFRWRQSVLEAAQRKLAWERQQYRPIVPKGVYRVHQQIRDVL